MAHNFQHGLFGTLRCEDCHLIPLDSEDSALPCPQSISSGHFSLHDQIADAVSLLSHDESFVRLMEGDFVKEFPEYNRLEWSGSWVDHEASGVDPDYMSWVCDWIEANTPVFWEDGEPYFDRNFDYIEPEEGED